MEHWQFSQHSNIQVFRRQLKGVQFTRLTSMQLVNWIFGKNVAVLIMVLILSQSNKIELSCAVGLLSVLSRVLHAYCTYFWCHLSCEAGF